MTKSQWVIILIFLLIFIAAGILYATRYVGQEWVGVKPLLSDAPQYLHYIGAIIIWILVGVAVYYLRRMVKE
jgi:uncharacterized protein involved in cysteine biosynthesis